MAKYRYDGPGPIEVLSGGELIKPGDIREFEQEPDWGPWDLLPDGEPGDDSPPEDRDAVAEAARIDLRDYPHLMPPVDPKDM